MTIGDIFLDNERHVVYVDNKGIELTYKEYELLKLLMHNAGIVLTREKIMERVWDTEFEGESRTVDMHIKTPARSWETVADILRRCEMLGM